MEEGLEKKTKRGWLSLAEWRAPRKVECTILLYSRNCIPKTIVFLSSVSLSLSPCLSTPLPVCLSVSLTISPFLLFYLSPRSLSISLRLSLNLSPSLFSSFSLSQSFSLSLSPSLALHAGQTTLGLVLVHVKGGWKRG